MIPERLEPLKPVTEDELVELDVRPALRAGGEPFSQIMRTAGEVPAGHVLRLRGWKHWIERGGGLP